MSEKIKYFLMIGFASCFFLTACNKENIDSTEVVEEEITIDTSFCNLEISIVEIDSSGVDYLTTAVNGGTNPLAYQWSQGATSDDIAVTTNGNYSVTVTDNLGCTKAANYNYSTVNPCLSLQVEITSSIDSVSNTILIANPSGGTIPYSYLWSEGSSTPDIIVMPSGTFTVTVTDDLGCTAEDNFQF